MSISCGYGLTTDLASLSIPMMRISVFLSNPLILFPVPSPTEFFTAILPSGRFGPLYGNTSTNTQVTGIQKNTADTSTSGYFIIPAFIFIYQPAGTGTNLFDCAQMETTVQLGISTWTCTVSLTVSIITSVVLIVI